MKPTLSPSAMALNLVNEDITMNQAVPEVLSCIQPTGGLHLGNYFGAITNWIELQKSHVCLFGVVDLHAMTTPCDAAELRMNTDRMVLDLLACGVGEGGSQLFIQSKVPEHAELCWILSCFCSFGSLKRMTQFKEKQAKTLESDFTSVGLFTYPVLQAADVLAYRAKLVPVGSDQEQHLELAREIARRFNDRCKAEYFPEPRALLTPTPRIMSLADPARKMSKSAGDKHDVGIFEDEVSIRRKVGGAVTDGGRDALDSGVRMSPGVRNLLEILRACGANAVAAEMEQEYDAGTLKYKDLKGHVADALVELTDRLRARRDRVAEDTTATERVRQMSEQARYVARETLREVRELIGLS